MKDSSRRYVQEERREGRGGVKSGIERPTGPTTLTIKRVEQGTHALSRLEGGREKKMKMPVALEGWSRRPFDSEKNISDPRAVTEFRRLKKFREKSAKLEEKTHFGHQWAFDRDKSQRLT